MRPRRKYTELPTMHACKDRAKRKVSREKVSPENSPRLLCHCKLLRERTSYVLFATQFRERGGTRHKNRNWKKKWRGELQRRETAMHREKAGK